MTRGSITLFVITVAALPGALRPAAEGSAVVAPVSSEAGAAESDSTAGTRVRPLPFFYDLYTFRGDRGATTVLAAFAVPVRRLQRTRVSGLVRYRFDVTLVLADTARRSVSRTNDSVFVSVPTPLEGRHLLYTHVQVQAPPSTATLQRVVMTDASRPGTGQLYGSAFPIPDYSGSHLMLSDIALGQPGARQGWRRGAVTLALLPTSQLPESAFDLYYEIYNLPAGSPYATELVIERLQEDDDHASPTGSAVRTRFAEESHAGPEGTQRELRSVSTALQKGRYRLTVHVTDQRTGRSATKSRTFTVRGWDPGATLVPALPAERTGSIGR